MSEFETVALIVIFLVLSAIIVRLIGGDADLEPMTRRARGNAQAQPDTATASPQVRQQQHAAIPARSEPIKPRPVEPAMVKVDLPPPTPIPDPRIANVQTAAPAAQPVAPSAAEALAAVRAAAPAPQPVAQTATAPVAPAPTTAAVQAQTAAAAQAATVAPVRPSAAATVGPDDATKADAAHMAQRPAGEDPAPAVQKPEPAAAPAKQDVTPPAQVRAAEPRDAATAPAANATVTLSKPDVTATLAPGATSSPAATSTQPAAKQLSGEDQAIISRYLRPDVKATLYRDPPPGWTPPPAPAPRAVEPPPPAAPRAAPVAPPAGPLVISRPRIEATVPPGYQAPAPQPKAGPVGPATGFAPLGVLPDARATIAGGDAPSAKPLSAAAAPQAAVSSKPQATDDASPRALRAASIPPSTAVERAIAAQPQSQSSDPALLSTAKRGTRVIGADAASADAIDLERPSPPRPQTPSIWSNTVPRRAITDSEIFTPEAAIAPPSVRAERIPVRAGTLLVRPDAARTIDPSAPKYTSIPKPPPVASLRSEARPLPENGRYANVRFTLPPGALGEE